VPHAFFTLPAFRTETCPITDCRAALCHFGPCGRLRTIGEARTADVLGDQAHQTDTFGTL